MLVAVPDRDPLVPVVEPLAAAEVEDLGLPAEHHRDDPGLAGQLAGLVGGDRVPGVQQRRGLAVAEQVLQGHGDHHGGVDAAGLGEPVDRVAGDVLAERVPEPFGGAGVAAGAGVS